MKNVGKIDSISRLVLGVVILSLAFIGPQSSFAYIGIVPIVTGIFGFCPLYKIIGLNTCKLKQGEN